jgi:peptidoglycan/LPS O-acetylase OafA/YrhL
VTTPTSAAAADAVRPVGLAGGRTWFPELESLRGIAILLVFFFHADGLLHSTHAEGTWPNPLMAWIHVGSVGVDLFFVLSGFLLSIPFLEAARGGRPVSVPHYFERRALRILPLYWLAVVIATVVSARTPEQLLRGVPYLFFLNSVEGWTHALLPHSIPWWSLATEVQFYLLLPVIGALLASPARRAVGLGLLAAWAVGYGIVLTGQWPGLGIPGRLGVIASIVGRLPVFLLGILAAWIHLRWSEPLRARLERSALARAGGADLAMAALVLAGGVLLSAVTFLGNARAHMGFRPLWHAGIAACMTAMLLLVLLAPLRLRVLWVNPVLGRIGVLSYSLFLIHLWPMDWVMRRLYGPDHGWSLAAFGTVILLLAGCLALSELTYRFVERPFLARKARIAT